MQYWQRKLQRSVTDSRKFPSGRPSVSFNTPTVVAGEVIVATNLILVRYAERVKQGAISNGFYPSS